MGPTIHHHQEGATVGADSSSGTEGQEPQGQQQDQGQEPGSGSQGQEPGSQGFDLSKITDPDARAYVEALQTSATKARTEAADYRTKYQGTKAEVDKFQRERETDAERIQRETAERDQQFQAVLAENRDLKVTTAVDKAAVAARAINPATVARMIKGDVTLDDKGQPENIDDLIKNLAKTDAYLFRRPATTDAGNRGNQSQGTGSGINDLLRGRGRAAR